MATDTDLSMQLERLKSQHQLLRDDYRLLQAQMQKQMVSADAWLEQRTKELQAEAI